MTAFQAENHMVQKKVEINDQVMRIPVGHAAIPNGSWSPTVLPTDLAHFWKK